MIRFRQIEAFRSLIMTGTSVGAARKMHVTQPAISRLIADLEADLGFSLFSRIGGRLNPTTAGLRFYKSVEENFLGLERLKQVADMIRDEASEGLTVACMPVLATTLLPPILADFVERHPGVPIRVDSVKVPEVLLSLQNHKADVAISQAFPAVAGIEVQTLLRTRALCAMPAGHRLAKKKVVRAQDLRGERIIGWLPNSRQAYEAEQSTISAAEERPNYTVLTDTAHTRYAMVAGGLGVSIVEPFAAKVWRAHGVVVRPFEAPADYAIEYEYALSYPSSGIRSDLVASFRESALRVIERYSFDD
ncbi:LysR family transcriptional regulator [Caballeronia telluris]|uniref:LysR family transcriptional regulator n=2 Tax=Caballeronia telluris TaxID=326475 RepID=A0A158IVT1_9BURK|nr:LysR substrate-binding domain-containing protein [Caballeronia telluris]SAL60373.1 LysR family transcriptional regulator [Caballeronia telluris]